MEQIMSNTTLSKTAAIKAARKAVGSIIRRSNTDYVFYAPYYNGDLTGPTTELKASSYPQAVLRRTQKIADIALEQMGHGRAVVEAGENGTTVEQLVAAGIAQAAQGYPYDYQ
jgi:hypothetical protein